MTEALLTTIRPESAVAAIHTGWTDCDFDLAAFSPLADSGIARAVFRRLPNQTPSLAPAAEQHPVAARYVLDAPTHPEPATLRHWHALGVRGLRLTLTDDASQAGDLLRTADAIAPLDWHLELTLAPHLASLQPFEWTLTCLPVAICLGGLADFAAHRDLDDPDLGFILELLEMGRTWIKLSPTASGDTDTALVAAFAAEAIAVRPDRIVWGSGRHGQESIGHALAELTRWIPDRAIRDTILTVNPAQLYRF